VRDRDFFFFFFVEYSEAILDPWRGEKYVRKEGLDYQALESLDRNGAEATSVRQTTLIADELDIKY